jgi:hypothetical protein
MKIRVRRSSRSRDSKPLFLVVSKFEVVNFLVGVRHLQIASLGKPEANRRPIDVRSNSRNASQGKKRFPLPASRKKKSKELDDV